MVDGACCSLSLGTMVVVVVVVVMLLLLPLRRNLQSDHHLLGCWVVGRHCSSSSCCCRRRHGSTLGISHQVLVALKVIKPQQGLATTCVGLGAKMDMEVSISQQFVTYYMYRYLTRF